MPASWRVEEGLGPSELPQVTPFSTDVSVSEWNFIPVQELLTQSQWL